MPVIIDCSLRKPVWAYMCLDDNLAKRRCGCTGQIATRQIAGLRSDFDEHLFALDHGFVGLHRDHAGRVHNLAGFDVERAVVEIALDDVAIDIALVQQAGAVGAEIVGDVELAVQVEHGELQIVGLDPNGLAFGNRIDIAEFYFRRHGALDCYFGTDINGLTQLRNTVPYNGTRWEWSPIALKQGQSPFSTPF